MRFKCDLNAVALRHLSLSYSPDNRLVAANDADYAYNGLCNPPKKSERL